MTYDEVERTQEKAVRFLHDVVGDPDKADEFEAMSPEEYAEHEHTPKRSRSTGPVGAVRVRPIGDWRPRAKNR